MTRSTVYFSRVIFQLPSFIDVSKIAKTACSTRHPIGYKHMCRFHALGVYQQPIMKVLDIDFALRLDDDSLFIRNVTYDMFDYMRRNGLLYGYVSMVSDVAECIVGLREAVDFYVRNESLTPHFFHQWPLLRMYYNNFELSSVSIWRSAEYLKFIRYIDELGGIYYVRWGDATIETFAVTLFVPRQRTKQLPGIGYQHQGVRT